MNGFVLSAVIWLVAAATLPAVQGEIWETREELSIGTKHPISLDGRQVPGWTLLGVSQIFRDRIIMTPLHPGSVRSAVWSERANSYQEWSAELEFRANGEERSGGSFQFWYTAGTSAPQGTDSVYTAKPWDGLAILVDKYGSYGGSVRGFLNDGKTDYSIHHDIASLAFAHCDFQYRNQGSLSKIKITHTLQGLKVEAGGSICFETKEVRLASNNIFGVSAASADSPDSFELFSIKISSTQSAQDAKSEEPQKKTIPQDADHTVKSQESIVLDNKGTLKEPQGKLSEGKFKEWKEEVSDHPASFYKSSEEQFRDLHDRLTALTHHLSATQVQLGAVYDKIDGASTRMEAFREEMRNNRISREQIDRVEARLSAVEGVIRDLEKVLHSKDYNQHFDTLHSALKEQTSSLMHSVPGTVANAVQQRHGKLIWGVWIGLGAQLILLGGYVWHKRRKGAIPKKYL